MAEFRFCYNGANGFSRLNLVFSFSAKFYLHLQETVFSLNRADVIF